MTVSGKTVDRPIPRCPLGSTGEMVSLLAQLDQSLRRLQTDYINMLQFHEIIHEEEPEKIFNEGAIDAAS